MGQIVDLTYSVVGDDGPGGSTVDECPMCGLPGIWLNLANSKREAFAHEVDADNLNLVAGCLLDSGGDA